MDNVWPDVNPRTSELLWYAVWRFYRFDLRKFIFAANCKDRRFGVRSDFFLVVTAVLAKLNQTPGTRPETHLYNIDIFLEATRLRDKLILCTGEFTANKNIADFWSDRSGTTWILLYDLFFNLMKVDDDDLIIYKPYVVTKIVSINNHYLKSKSNWIQLMQEQLPN